MVHEPIQGKLSAGDTILRSAFHGDADMVEIVAIFLDELPVRIVSLQKWFQDGNFDSFRRLVHQLKGAGGGYGFDLISEQAEAILRLMDQGQEDWQRRIEPLHDRFTDTLRRAHASRSELPA